MSRSLRGTVFSYLTTTTEIGPRGTTLADGWVVGSRLEIIIIMYYYNVVKTDRSVKRWRDSGDRARHGRVVFISPACSPRRCDRVIFDRTYGLPTYPFFPHPFSRTHTYVCTDTQTRCWLSHYYVVIVIARRK